MTDDIESDDPCPKCRKKQWWLDNKQYDENKDVVLIISHCSACRTQFVREVPVTHLNEKYKIIKSDAVIIEEVIEKMPECKDITAIFLQKNWKALDPAIRRVEKAVRGGGYEYFIDNRRGKKGPSGHYVPSQLMAKVAMLIHNAKHYVKTADVYKHCQPWKKSTINHTLRLLRHIGVIRSPRVGLHEWSFELAEKR
jgi:hypothetical protein